MRRILTPRRCLLRHLRDRPDRGGDHRQPPVLPPIRRHACRCRGPRRQAHLDQAPLHLAEREGRRLHVAGKIAQYAEWRSFASRHQRILPTCPVTTARWRDTSGSWPTSCSTPAPGATKPTAATRWLPGTCTTTTIGPTAPPRTSPRPHAFAPASSATTPSRPLVRRWHRRSRMYFAVGHLRRPSPPSR